MGEHSRRRVLAVLGVLVLPLAGPLTGRSWAAIEVAGTAPTPTALVTLGMLLMARRRSWIAALIPMLWLIYSSVSWWVSGWLTGVLVVPIAVAFLVAGGFAGGGHSRTERR